VKRVVDEGKSKLDYVAISTVITLTISSYISDLSDAGPLRRDRSLTWEFSQQWIVIQPPVQWVPGVLSSRLKCGQCVTLTTHPHLVPRSRMSRSYTSPPPKSFRGV
jgi:hypothetical protein